VCADLGTTGLTKKPSAVMTAFARKGFDDRRDEAVIRLLLDRRIRISEPSRTTS